MIGFTRTHDADGQRVAKEGEVVAGVGYLYDQKKLLHETDDIGAINKTFASDMTDEYGDLIGEGGHVHQYDAQANTEALLEADGTVEARYKYTAFGQVHAVQLGGSGTWSAEDWQDLPLALSSEMLAGINIFRRVGAR